MSFYEDMDMWRLEEVEKEGIEYERIAVWFDKKYANNTQKEIIQKAFSVIKRKFKNYKVGVHVNYVNDKKLLYIDVKDDFMLVFCIEIKNKKRNLVVKYHGKDYYIEENILPEVENEFFSF